MNDLPLYFLRHFHIFLFSSLYAFLAPLFAIALLMLSPFRPASPFLEIAFSHAFH